MERILVVDDDPMITRLVKTDLELSGYEVEEAWDGESTMRILKENPPDLLVLDIMMPRTDGWDVLKMVRGNESLADLPVVILTAMVHDEDIMRGWEMGADDYIVKPFNPITLVDRLRALLDSTPEERRGKRQRELASRLGVPLSDPLPDA